MKKLFALLLCLCLLVGTLAACTTQNADPSDPSSPDSTNAPGKESDTIPPADNKENEELKARWRAEFLKSANEVVVTEDSVTFTDASSTDGSTVTIKKNPGKVINLYGSLTTLWYEAGGTVFGCIGGSSTQSLYTEYIGRDITEDEGVTVVANSLAGSKWNMESILSYQPDLLICSTAMSGYKTVKAPAESANVPVIAIEYNDFSDYLKWFKVFCNLTGHTELWDSVAMKALNDVVDVLCEIPDGNAPHVFSMFADSKSLQANTSLTVVGGMISTMKAKNIVDDWENTTNADKLTINLETVLAANPDIIVVQCHGDADAAKKQVEDTYGDNPIWLSLNAVKNGKVFYLEKTLFHNKPNSRFAEAYQKLAEILYPNVAFSFKNAQ